MQQLSAAAQVKSPIHGHSGFCMSNEMQKTLCCISCYWTSSFPYRHPSSCLLSGNTDSAR